MEVLTVLEQKIVALVALTKTLHHENAQLKEQLVQLRTKSETLEHALLARNEHAAERNQELAIAHVVLDELIQSIDSVLLQALPEQRLSEQAPSAMTPPEEV